MNTMIRTTVATALATVMLVGATAMPALAAPADVTVPDTLPAIQAAGARATAARISAINRTVPDITRTSCLTDAHRSTALDELTTALGGMNTLRDEIAADTTTSVAADHYRSIFVDWRVDGVVIPQTRYAVGADCIENVSIPALVEAQTALIAAVAAADPSKVTPAVEADMAQLDTQIAGAKADIAGVADEALAVTAADYNSNKAVLSDVKVSISSATSAVKLARIAAADVAKALK